jgi:cation diffusion facilitator family transporter
LHMFSHVLVLTLAWAAYFVARATANGENYKRQKLVITLSGFASAVVFLVMTVLMAYRSIRGFFEKDMEVMPAAIAVAIVGLVVNGLSAYLLHREEDKSDPNLKAAFMHVMSDMVLSVFAIVSLAVVQFWDVRWVDSALGLVAAMVFLYWAVRLLISSGRQIISAV